MILLMVILILNKYAKTDYQKTYTAVDRQGFPLSIQLKYTEQKKTFVKIVTPGSVSCPSNDLYICISVMIIYPYNRETGYSNVLHPKTSLSPEEVISSVKTILATGRNFLIADKCRIHQ